MPRRAAPHRGIDTDHGDGSVPSRTELKRQSEALQQLGRELAEMPADRLARIDMPDELRAAILAWRGIRAHEGGRRQMQYIGKLMRSADADALREAVAASKIGSAAQTLALHEAERWRDSLIADDDALTRWMQDHPDCDAQQLRSLVRAARRDGAAQVAEQRQPRSYRDLFQFIRPLLAGSQADEPATTDESDAR